MLRVELGLVEQGLLERRLPPIRQQRMRNWRLPFSFKLFATSARAYSGWASRNSSTHHFSSNVRALRLRGIVTIRANREIARGQVVSGGHLSQPRSYPWHIPYAVTPEIAPFKAYYRS